ncbi:MAG: DEAD/DEAH box helicase [Ilumatobacteraceae bacterium]
MRSDRQDLISRYSFGLDRFQLAALDVVDDGESIIVAAPTGSGKTVVAEYAIAAALADRRRAFYTAPIKALSNQKYQDLVRVHGRESVGLLTGDNSINGDAPVVVMTTEVLRNMMYARSPALSDLATVVLDEVHFIQDTYRGPVWEEVIIHLPHHIQLVCLSATVSNVAEVAEWMSTVRGTTRFIVEEKRPVDLENHIMVGEKGRDEEHFLPVLVSGRPNPTMVRLEEHVRVARGRGGGRTRLRYALQTPRRLDVVERLRREDLLPAIFFIFSRQACEEAAHSCLSGGLRLTTPFERSRIATIIEDHTAGLEADDLDVLGFGRFAEQLAAGIATHHAGMIPPFKEAVEKCFVEGLIKVVFATETLAVGINMPARSVVIEKLTKFTGDHHEFLTPGQFTQLTGRAGRRGLDERGHAVVLWNPFVRFEQVVGLATSRSYRLTSSFRPTYNMAANLIRSYTREQARHLLNLSLAQYQSDRDVVRFEARAERRQLELEDLLERAHSPYGDIEVYRRAVRERAERRSEVLIEEALTALRPGAVIHVDNGKFSGRAAVLATAMRSGGTKVSVLTAKRSLYDLTARDFADPPMVLATIDIPRPYTPTRQDFQKKVADRIVRTSRRTPGTKEPAPGHPGEPRGVDESEIAREIERLRADPDLTARLAAADEADRVRADIARLSTQVQSRSSSISRQFDDVLNILETWNYVHDWSLTEKGRVLARTFHESDLLVAECLNRGHLDGLDPSTFAGLLSTFVYEHRSSEAPPEPWFPSPEARKRWRRIEATSRELRLVEHDGNLTVHRSPDPTYVAIAYAWAMGEEFAEVVETEELSGGDFVRTMKQLIDLTRQVALIAPIPETRRCAEQAAELLRRGVVAASSAMEDSDD